ncbi:MAG: hypothetical protein AAF430_12740 [Myxococcota bacterium]
MRFYLPPYAALALLLAVAVHAATANATTAAYLPLEFEVTQQELNFPGFTTCGTNTTVGGPELSAPIECTGLGGTLNTSNPDGTLLLHFDGVIGGLGQRFDNLHRLTVTVPETGGPTSNLAVAIEVEALSPPMIVLTATVVRGPESSSQIGGDGFELLGNATASARACDDPACVFDNRRAVVALPPLPAGDTFETSILTQIFLSNASVPPEVLPISATLRVSLHYLPEPPGDAGAVLAATLLAAASRTRHRRASARRAW